MEVGKGERYLASGRQYGNALLGVRHQPTNQQFIFRKLNQILQTTLQTTAEGYQRSHTAQ